MIKKNNNINKKKKKKQRKATVCTRVIENRRKDKVVTSPNSMTLAFPTRNNRLSIKHKTQRPLYESNS